MIDPRLAQAAALLDDARSLLVDVVDAHPDATPLDLNNIDAARQFLNSALPYIQMADSGVAG
jgi:hypothetical protein